MIFGKMDINNPTEQHLRNIDIHTLLPQQPPFVMVGKLIHYDSVRTITETQIERTNIFCDDGVFSSTGMMENIAQTCAVRIGYINKYVLHKGVQIGVIGAIRKLKITDRPHVGDVITTTIEVIEELLGITLASATIECGGRVLATSQIKIAVREEAQ